MSDIRFASNHDEMMRRQGINPPTMSMRPGLATPQFRPWGSTNPQTPGHLYNPPSSRLPPVTPNPSMRGHSPAVLRSPDIQLLTRTPRSAGGGARPQYVQQPVAASENQMMRDSLPGNVVYLEGGSGSVDADDNSGWLNPMSVFFIGLVTLSVLGNASLSLSLSLSPLSHSLTLTLSRAHSSQCPSISKQRRHHCHLHSQHHQNHRHRHHNSLQIP